MTRSTSLRRIPRITPDQVAKFQELLAVSLRRSALPSVSMQKVLDDDGKRLVDDLVTSIRSETEKIATVFTRRIKVDRSLSFEEAFHIKLGGFNRWDIDKKVVASMPRGIGEKVEVIFFPYSYHIADRELSKEYKKRNLRPVDPYSLAAVNKVYPYLFEHRRNGTHWRDKKGGWYFASFEAIWHGSGFGGGYSDCLISIGCHNERWDGGKEEWWFAGVRK